MDLKMWVLISYDLRDLTPHPAPLLVRGEGAALGYLSLFPEVPRDHMNQFQELNAPTLLF